MHITVKSLPKPPTRKTQGKTGWVLTSDYEFSLVLNGELKCFTIPKGYDFDGKSVPKLVEVLTLGRVKRRDERYFKEVLVHDWLYDNKDMVKDIYGEPFEYDRKDADQIYREIMKYLGRSGIRVMAEYGVVRALGWSVWEN